MSDMNSQACRPKAAATDGDLIQAIANDQDRDAFGELYRRHEQATYNLAFHLSRDQESALESCQEAWIRVWKSAGSYRPSAPVRNWLLSITANATFTNLTKRQRIQKRSAPQEALDFIPVEAEKPVVERQELIASLKRSMLSLPETSQKLLTLYYGAGLSQREIGRKLNLPQRTVSLKLEQAVDLLRGIVSRAGLGAALSGSIDESLAEAMTQGITPPAQLWAGIEKGIESTGVGATEEADLNDPASPSEKVSTYSGKTVALSLGGTAFIAAVCIAIVYSPSKPDPLSVSASDADSKSRPAVRWSFEDAREAKRFEVIEGHQQHISNGGPDGSGALHLPEGGAILIPHKISTLPLSISFDFALYADREPKNPLTEKALGHKPKTFGYNEYLLWRRIGPLASIANIDKSTQFKAEIAKPYPKSSRFHPDGILTRVVDEKRMKWSRQTFYVSESAVQRWCHERRASLLITERGDNDHLVIVLTGGHIIDNLEIRQIDKNAIPDVSEYVAAIKAIPPEKRISPYVLKQFKSANPPQPVYVQFRPGRQKKFRPPLQYVKQYMAENAKAAKLRIEEEAPSEQGKE